MKVLHISQASGGVKTYLDHLINNTTGDFHHYLITPDSSFKVSLDSNAQVFLVNISRTPSFLDLISLVRTVRIARKIKPDIIHCHSAKGGVIGRIIGFLTGIRVVFTPNGFSYLPFEGFKRGLFLTVEKLLKNWTSKFLGVSLSEELRALNEIGYPSIKVTHVPNSISIGNRVKEDYNLRGKVGMIGRLTYQKDPVRFVELAFTMKEYKFELLGSGFHDDLRAEIDKKLGSELKPNVELVAWGQYEDIYDFYDSVDLFILTSKFEGLPFSLLEAMEFGLPCVVSNVDGNKDAIEHGVDGFIYNSPEELYRYTKELMEDSALREKIGKNARAKVCKTFNIKNNVREIENVYHQVFTSI